MKETKSQMNLLENAFDFLEEASERLIQSEETMFERVYEKLINPKEKTLRNHKYAILHLPSAVELLLKKRLYDEHWSLIFADVNKAEKVSLNEGTFKSVYFQDAVKRLENVCQIEFPKHHKEILELLKIERNRIEHFDVKIDRSKAISLMVKIWLFIFDFISNEISIDSDDAMRSFVRIRSNINNLNEYVKHRMLAITPRIQQHIQDGNKILNCFDCRQDALVVTPTEAQCLFCEVQYELPIICQGCGKEIEVTHSDDLIFQVCSGCWDSVVLGRESWR